MSSDANYTQRRIQTLENAGFNRLQVEAKSNLVRIIHAQFADLDCDDAKSVATQLDVLKKAYQRNPHNDSTKPQIDLLKEYQKVISLKPVEIPQQQGPALDYCSLEDSAGGVTEKVSLISFQKAEQRLTQLVNLKSFNDYQNIVDGKLRMNAIIKLPKHGNNLEVHRELMALNISRLLNFDTASSTMVDYEGAPGLFVPFDDIQLLSELAQGEEKTARLGLSSWGKKYLHYSTMNAVGAGIHGNRILDDFGDKLAYFYLCSDTDAIGGYNQNKGVRNNGLYVFDQVVMPSDKVKIDSRMSMQPTAWLGKHTRHEQFRNRSIIEDSDFSSKFESLLTLQKSKDKIIVMMDNLIANYQNQIDSIDTSKPLNLDERQRLKQLEELKRDAETLKTVLITRIDRVTDILPSVNNAGDANETTIQKHSLMLEKLLNKPTLFAEDGRPYRHPHTYRNQVVIHTINVERQFSKIKEETAEIIFNEPIDRMLLLKIQNQLGDGVKLQIRHDNKAIKIPLDIPEKINDKLLFPEWKLQVDAEYDYLNISDLRKLSEGYKSDPVHAELMLLLKKYNEEDKSCRDLKNKIDLMSDMAKELNSLKSQATNKGFISHVQKKFDYKVQQQLNLLVDDHPLKEKMNQAFEVAVKLDRVKEFHDVCKKALYNGVELTGYLDEVIAYNESITDMTTASDYSQKLRDTSGFAMREINSPQIKSQVDVASSKWVNVMEGVGLPRAPTIVVESQVNLQCDQSGLIKDPIAELELLSVVGGRYSFSRPDQTQNQQQQSSSPAVFV